MQVYQPVHNVIGDLKKSLGMSNVSEVILYLYAVYDGHYPKLTMPEHQEALRKVKDLLDQETL